MVMAKHALTELQLDRMRVSAVRVGTWRVGTRTRDSTARARGGVRPRKSISVTAQRRHCSATGVSQYILLILFFDLQIGGSGLLKLDGNERFSR